MDAALAAGCTVQVFGSESGDVRNLDLDCPRNQNYVDGDWPKRTTVSKTI
jgi:hypothetical protein